MTWPARQPFVTCFHVASLNGGPGDAMCDLLTTWIGGIFLPRVVESFAEDILSVLGKVLPHRHWQIVG